mgnify:FL=1|jgi:hypothetical protein|tara:strand:- start:266 stop:745 length:480 start_codon:yes stop_codon:yes gene_type:complete
MFEHMKVTQITYVIKKASLVFLVVGLFLMCESPIFIPEGAFEEVEVDMSGSWKITAAYRNGIEISDKFDFSDFGLKLNVSNSEATTYHIETKQVPFPVISDGNWKYNDPVYPTQMLLLSALDTAIIEFVASPISGFNEMRIQFQLGCSDNAYIYDLELR